MKIYTYPPFPLSPPPSGIFTTIPLHRTTQRLISTHPSQDILNSHTVFLNIKKSTLHVLKVFPRSCTFVLIRDCIGPSVYGPPRGAWLLRIIEGYGPPPPEIPERLPNFPQKESSVRKSTKQLWIHQTHDGLSPVYQWTFLW